MRTRIAALRDAARSTTAVAPVLRRCACGGKKQNGPCECRKADEPSVSRSPGHRLADMVIDEERGLATVRNVLAREPGEPLARGVRQWAEGAFGRSFARVRIHTSNSAQGSARDVGAAAYTVGQHVVFGAGGYQPGTSAGRQLLAHELAHTLQQGPVHSLDGLSIGSVDAPAEREADVVAAHAVSGAGVQPVSNSAGDTVARAPGDAHPAQSAPDTDTCANFETDPQSMAWSITREIYRASGKSWPGIGTAECNLLRDSDRQISCTMEMNDGLTAYVGYNPDTNTVKQAGLVDRRGSIKVIRTLCDMTYTCSEPSKVDFTSECLPWKGT